MLTPGAACEDCHNTEAPSFLLGRVRRRYLCPECAAREALVDLSVTAELAHAMTERALTPDQEAVVIVLSDGQAALHAPPDFPVRRLCEAIVRNLDEKTPLAPIGLA